MTGYTAPPGLPARLATHRRLSKPFTDALLLDTLRELGWVDAGRDRSVQVSSD